MFEGLLGTNKPKRLEVYHEDNGDINFVYHDIIGRSTSEYDETGLSKRSWSDFYKNLYHFNGYENIRADAVKPTFGRAFHLEIHDVLNDDERPPEGNKLNSPFMTAVAEDRFNDIARSKKPRTMYEKLTLMLGAALFIELLIWGISYATR